MLTAIWTQGKNGVIGKDSVMPWHLPNDLKYFKEQTLNHTIILGRKTFEGMGKRPLPNRKTIVVTTEKNYSIEGVEVVNHPDDLLNYIASQSSDSFFVAGGSEIYKILLPYCDCLKRTWIDSDFDGDTYFPEVDWDNWELTDKLLGKQNEKNPYTYYFESYIRKN